jgi:hypothetical protein
VRPSKNGGIIVYSTGDSAEAFEVGDDSNIIADGLGSFRRWVKSEDTTAIALQGETHVTYADEQ